MTTQYIKIWNKSGVGDANTPGYSVFSFGKFQTDTHEARKSEFLDWLRILRLLYPVEYGGLDIEEEYSSIDMGSSIEEIDAEPCKDYVEAAEAHEARYGIYRHIPAIEKCVDILDILLRNAWVDAEKDAFTLLDETIMFLQHKKDRLAILKYR